MIDNYFELVESLPKFILILITCHCLAAVPLYYNARVSIEKKRVKASQETQSLQ